MSEWASALRRWLRRLGRQFDSTMVLHIRSTRTVTLNGERLEGAEADAVAEAIDEASDGMSKVFDRLHDRLKAR